MFGKRKNEEQNKRKINCRNETRIITAMRIKKERKEFITVEFLLRSKEAPKDERVFTKTFDKWSTIYNKWSHKKIGDEVTVLIDQDEIMRDIS